MKHFVYKVQLLLAFLLGAMSASTHAQQAPSYLWAKSGGGSDDDRGGKTAVDAAGNVYITGVFRGTVRFGTTTFTSRGDYDIYLAKYSAQGQLTWIRQIGGPDRDWVHDLAVDASGNCYLTGDFATFYTAGLSTITIGNTTLTAGSSFSEMFLAKYDGQGAMLWARQTVSQGPSSGGHVAVDRAGNVYLTGVLAGSARLDQFTFSFPTGANQFLAKYDRQGTAQWVKTGLGAGVNYNLLEAVTTDAAGEVYFVGYFRNRLVLGTTTLTTANASTAGMYLVKFDSQGNVLWVKQVEKTGSGCCDGSSGLAVDPCGDLVLSLFFERTLLFDHHAFTSQGGTDILTLKCSPQGTFIWGAQLGGTYANAPNVSANTDGISRPVIDAKGNIYINASLIGMPTLSTNVSYANFYAHLVCYTPAGTMRWTRTAGAYILDIAVSKLGELYATGSLDYSRYFDGLTLTSVGGSDAYVTKLAASTIGTTPLGCPPIADIPPDLGNGTIPNIITPNGDDQNEAFRLPGLSPGPWQLDVYNRWGTRVYHTANYHQDWNAPGLPDGQYYYYLQAPNQPAHKGWLEVMR